MKLLVAAVLVLVAIGAYVAVPHWQRATKQAQIDAKQAQALDAARKPVAHVLKDPASAQFRTEVIQADEQTVCGEVNAKNSYGAFVGFKKYVSNGRNFLIEGAGFISWPVVEVPAEFNEEVKAMHMFATTEPRDSMDQLTAESAKRDLFKWYWSALCKRAAPA